EIGNHDAGGVRPSLEVHARLQCSIAVAEQNGNGAGLTIGRTELAGNREIEIAVLVEVPHRGDRGLTAYRVARRNLSEAAIRLPEQDGNRAALIVDRHGTRSAIAVEGACGGEHAAIARREFGSAEDVDERLGGSSHH